MYSNKTDKETDLTNRLKTRQTHEQTDIKTQGLKDRQTLRQ